MQFDPKDVVVTFGGVLIQGFADGTFIDISYDADLWRKKIGADGFGVFTKSNDLSATTTFLLMPGAISNEFLSLKLNADIAANLGFGPLEILDPATGTAHLGLKSRIMKAAGKKYSLDAEPIEWVIATLEMKVNHGPALNPLI